MTPPVRVLVVDDSALMRKLIPQILETDSSNYGIQLPKQAAPLMKYAERIFSRPAFIEALTPSEKVMRK